MRYKIYYRYLFSYIAIFLLPIIVMTVMVSGYFMDIFKNEIAVNNKNSLQKTMDIVDSQLSLLSNINEQIYINKGIRSFHFEENPLEALNIISTLEGYTLTNSFLDDIYVLYRGENFMFSSSTSARSKYFIENKYICEDLGITPGNRNEFYEKFSTAAPRYFKLPKGSLSSSVYDEDGEQVILLAYAHSDGKAVEKIVFFTILEKAFKDMINPVNNISETNNIILNNHDDIVTMSDNKPEVQALDFPKLIKNMEDSKKNTTWHSLKLDGENYIMSYEESSFSNWKFISLAPENMVFSEFITARFWFIVIVCLVLLIGVAFIIILINKNYKPIRNLAQISEKLWKDETSNDELETVYNAINHLNSLNTELKNQVHDSEYAIKEYLLFQLLNGKITSMEEWNAKGKAINVQFTKPLFCVACIYIKNYKSSVFPELIAFVEKSLPVEVEGYIRDNTEFNKFVLIAAFDKNYQENIEAVFENIRRILRDKTGLSVTAGVGNHYSFREIFKSFMEANSALDYRFIKGTDRIIKADEIETNNTIVDKSIATSAQKLKTLIEKGEIESIENLLSNIVRYIKEGNMPVFSARMVCFDIINTAVGVAQNLFDTAECPIVMGDYPDIFQLSELETVDDITEIIKNVCKDIKELMTLSREGKKNISDIDQMIIYIKNNYTDCNWTFQQMADHFNIALPNLGSYFKANTGYNLLEYVTKLKIEKAKVLLTETNLMLKDICIECGYYNVTSFIRRFKQIEGITPGEYRNQSRNDKS